MPKEEDKQNRIQRPTSAKEEQDNSQDPAAKSTNTSKNADQDSFQFLASSIEIRPQNNINATHESFVSALTVTSSSSFTNDFASQGMMMMPLDESEKEDDIDGAAPTHSSKQSIGSMTMKMLMEELPPGMTSDEVDTVPPLPQNSKTHTSEWHDTIQHYFFC